MPKKRNIPNLITIALIIIVFLSAGTYLLYKHEITNKPIIAKKIAARDWNYLHKFYLLGSPDIEGLPYYGNSDATVKMIGYLDITSEASKDFINNIFPKIQDEFIIPGKLRYYSKTYISAQDIYEKNERYQYAASLICVNKIDPGKYFPYYLSIFNLSQANQIYILLQEYNISIKDFNSCISGQNFNEMSVDISEINHFGMAGIKQRFYIGIQNDYISINGVPEYDKFRRAIRENEFTLGE